MKQNICRPDSEHDCNDKIKTKGQVTYYIYIGLSIIAIKTDIAKLSESGVFLQQKRPWSYFSSFFG